MKDSEFRELVAHAGLLREACDLDLLVFFWRHPRALLTSEQLAAYIGYDSGAVARSIEGLIAAGLLSRSQDPTPHAGRLYVLKRNGTHGRWLTSLLETASTREGRQSLLRALKSGSSARVDNPRPRSLRKVIG
jgi:DNA-binding MarR family transcriptional regulator